MKKRTPKEWRRLVAAYERGGESRCRFCERHGLATSTLDYWRRRVRSDGSGRLVEAPLSGHVFLFANSTRTRLKVLVWDGSGLWVCTKKLGRGRYAWPTVGEGESRRVKMSQSELMLLLSGVDLAATKRREWWRKE